MERLQLGLKLIAQSVLNWWDDVRPVQHSRLKDTRYYWHMLYDAQAEELKAVTANNHAQVEEIGELYAAYEQACETQRGTFEELKEAKATIERLHADEVALRRYYENRTHAFDRPGTVSEVIEKMTPRVTVKLDRELDPMNANQIFRVNIQPEHVQFHATFDAQMLKRTAGHAREVVRAELYRNFERRVIPALWASLNYAIAGKGGNGGEQLFD